MLPLPSMASSDSPNPTQLACRDDDHLRRIAQLGWPAPCAVCAFRVLLLHCIGPPGSDDIPSHGAERLSDISVSLSHPSNAFCRHGLPSAVTVAPVQVSEPKYSAWRHLQAQGYSGEPLCSAWPAPLLPAGGASRFSPGGVTHTHPHAQMLMN